MKKKSTPTQSPAPRNWRGSAAPKGRRPQLVGRSGRPPEAITASAMSPSAAPEPPAQQPVQAVTTTSENEPTNRQTATEPETAKSMPGRRRSEASHQAILKAAAELLEEVGYVGMSIEAIARRAGVGKQTIYRWWPSKAEVVLEFYRRRVEQSLRDPDSGSIQSDLSQWVEQLVDLRTAAASARALVGIMAEAQADPALAQKFSDQVVAYRHRCIHAILRRGIDRGELRDDLNLELAADLIEAPVWYRLLLGSSRLDHQFSTQLVDEILLGLQAFEEDL